MIIRETVEINGKKFTHIYSDSGRKVERDGIVYNEAIDPVEFDRIYTETDENIEGYDPNVEYTEAGKILLGVSE